MKEYRVKYYLGEILHTEVVTATNEAVAILKIINRIPNPTIMHNFSIERYEKEWN